MKKKMRMSLVSSVLCAAFLLAGCHTAPKESAEEEDFEDVEIDLIDDAVLVQTGEELTIIAHVVVTEESKEDVLKAIEAVVEGTRQEDGNIAYDVYEDTANVLSFTFVEIWKSQSAIDAHNASEHFLAFVKAVEGKASLTASVLKQKF